LTFPWWGWYPSMRLPFFIILSLMAGATCKGRGDGGERAEYRSTQLVFN
jgi:hypothetical protein